MTRMSTATLRAAAFLAITCAGVIPAAAQDLPAAADIVERYRAAIGGKPALDAFQSMHSVGEFSIPAAGMSANFEAWAARPNRSAMMVVLPGFGEIRSGYTGEVGWSINPMEGPRLMEGLEAQQARDDAAFESFLRTPALVDSMQTVERTKLGGYDCIKVRMLWKSGRETFDCYSEETGLLVGTIQQQTSNMGTAEAISLYSDYKDFGGILMPTTVTVQMLGTEQVIRLTNVTFDAVADSVFALPPEIRALVGK